MCIQTWTSERCCALLVAGSVLLALAAIAPAFAQPPAPVTNIAKIGPGDGGSSDGIEPWVEYGKRVHAAERIAPLDNGFAGEQVSLYDGATSFSVTDINVPGNSALPVQLVRRFNVALRPVPTEGPAYDPRLLGAGNWDVDVPYIAATYPTTSGWPVGQDCPGGIVPPLALGGDGVFSRGDVWPGVTIHVPGRGDTNALAVDSQGPVPAGGAQYVLTTKQRDMLACIPMQSGFAGDGFRMTTAAGVTYYFNVGTTRIASTLSARVVAADGEAPVGILMPRTRYYLLASKIEDRFGNTVQFSYDANGHPTQIQSNDGRSISLTYSNGQLSTATSNSRIWQYQYDASGDLIAVVQPDGSHWQYAYSGSLTPNAPPPYENLTLPWCKGIPAQIDAGFTLTATAPSGAVATFDFLNTRHTRSGVSANECAQIGDPASPTYKLLVPNYFDVMSLTQKTISGPGMPSATWTYAYGGGFPSLWGVSTQPNTCPCTTCTLYTTTIVTNPDGTSQKYRYGMEYMLNEGRLYETDTLDGSGNVVRSSQSQYMTDAQAANQPFYGSFGDSFGDVDPVTVLIRPVTQTTITQDGATFTTAITGFDKFARGNSETETSVLGNQTYSKTDTTAYADDTSRWVLGMVTQSATNGIVSGQTNYDSLDRPTSHYAFGKLTSTKAWNADGTLASVTDGNGHTTSFANWYRGLPQNVSFADGTGESATVSAAGWITALTDQNGFTTNYAYDPMGRLAEISYPADDNVAWNPTLLSFTQVNGSEYGIPSGHWKQTIHTGNGYAVTYFDAMWRPLLSAHYDSGNEAGTLSQVVHHYDTMGRSIFTSYPANNISDYAATGTGVHTAYDALGRATEVDQDSELGTLKTTTAYLSGFQTQTTDPRGNSTLTSYQAYGQPTTKYPDLVTAPNGELTVILRDAFDKPLSITRTGTAAGSPSLTRAFAYDTYQELCGRTEPETGTTAYGYDGAGNLAWSASGLAATTGCYSFNLGELKISVLRDSALVFPNDGAIFGVNAGPAAVAKVLRKAGAQTDTIRLDVDTLLVRMPKHLVLIDVGYGVAGRSVVRQSLSLIGVSPDDVTDVLVTHAHPDHVGGLVDAEHRSAFPKATIWMSAKAWAFMHHEADVRAEVPVIEAQVKTFEPGHLVLPQITSIPLPGHTPGQVGYEIASHGDSLVDTGDIAHSSIISLAKPAWTLAWDSNKSEAVTTRHHELQRLADTHELMFAPHFPFPGVGRIETNGDGFRFQPARRADAHR